MSRVVVAAAVQLPQPVAARADSVQVQVLALPLAPITPLRLEQAAQAAPVAEAPRHIKGQPAAILFLALLLLLAAAGVVETARLRLD